MFDNLLNNYFVFTVNTIGVTLTKLLLSYVLTSNINIIVNYCGVLSCIRYTDSINIRSDCCAVCQ